MPYTLIKALIWLVLALIIGFAVGWLLRSLVAQRQVARARSQRVDTAEVERLRGRVANLESVVAERDRLAAELEAVRSAPSSDAPTSTESAGPGSPPSTSPGEVASFAAVSAAPADEAPPSVTEPTDDDAAAGSVPSTPDVAAGAVVLGRSIDLDDLKVIEGIGPKIEELCHGIGIRTWFDLATTEVSLLRTMLTDAGARYKMHDPTTWPQQADLLAHGRWEEFAELTAALDGGKAPKG